MMGPWKSAAGMLDVEITSADPAGALRTAAELGFPCESWVPVVEDVKSRATRTKEYIIKRKLMLEKYNIEIREV